MDWIPFPPGLKVHARRRNVGFAPGQQKLPTCTLFYHATGLGSYCRMVSGNGTKEKPQSLWWASPLARQPWDKCAIGWTTDPKHQFQGLTSPPKQSGYVVHFMRFQQLPHR
jgi:hypothetical protein